LADGLAAPPAVRPKLFRRTPAPSLVRIQSKRGGRRKANASPTAKFADPVSRRRTAAQAIRPGAENFPFWEAPLAQVPAPVRSGQPDPCQHCPVECQSGSIECQAGADVHRFGIIRRLIRHSASPSFLALWIADFPRSRIFLHEFPSPESNSERFE